ncbi:Flp pilus assembly complex ATPase component TadA [Candidatus Woesearchaeota archaeon]|nr:Flp pilus assembly complex ATPase component TadA [Candidatus Woesearchaeota archaeon]
MQQKKDWDFEVIKEGEENILYIYCEGVSISPLVEDSSIVMIRTIDILSQVSGISKIIFNQKRDYEYDFKQTQILAEIAELYKKLIKEKNYFNYPTAGNYDNRIINQKYNELREIIFKHMKGDPIGAYIELTRIMRREKIDLEKVVEQIQQDITKRYIAIISYVTSLLEKTRMLILAKPYIAGYKIGDRSVYKYIFTPSIKPDFMFTKLMANFPSNAEEIDSYIIGDDTDVTIFRLPDSTIILYHIVPPEFKLPEEKYELLDMARKILAEHKPKQEEFTDPERMREVFSNIGKDLLEEIATSKNIMLREKELQKLTQILVRYTIGFGLIEVLLQDDDMQDISINSPLGKIPIFIVHGKYGDCTTNIIPTKSESESWASKLRLISARPLDEANPILDTELELPGASTRVSVITRPLNPTGLAFSFRKHRDKPWTLPLFIKFKMLNPIAAGLISFLVDGTRTILIAGTRSAGKSSFLTGVLVEIMRKYRIITVEDSVAGDSEILIRNNNKWQRTTIGNLIDKQLEKQVSLQTFSGHEVAENTEDIEIFAMNKKGKIVVTKPSVFIRHKVTKPIYEIKTRTGKILKVTGDHSLFAIGENAEISEAKVNNLNIGNKIAVARKLPLINQEKEFMNILYDVIERTDSFITGLTTNYCLEHHFNDILSFGSARNVSSATIKSWRRNKVLPGYIAKDLMTLHQTLDFSTDKFRINNSQKLISLKIQLNEDFMTFIGLWIADGCYDKKSIIISCNDPEDRAVVEKVGKSFGIQYKMHSDGISYMLNSKTLKVVLQDILSCTGDSYTKRVPGWIYTLSPQQIAAFLRGVFTGDGCATDKEIVINLCSRHLLSDMQTLLLIFNISLRIGNFIPRDKTIRAAISGNEYLTSFAKYIGFLQPYKNNVLSRLCEKKITHDTTDTFDLRINTKIELANLFGKRFNKNDYINRNNSIGRRKLTSLLQVQSQTQMLELQHQILENLKQLLESDIYWDEIIEIEKMENFEGYVYDLSVPDYESFICRNIIAHNTLELPNKAFRDLGFNIQSMKVASALAHDSTEVSAEIGIRTTLRLGDSALIVGEVRSKEAVALYEAMRVGAAANVVAGTIHGDSPYGVYDRVVNDIGIPKTSFKATDIIIVTNPIKSADGMHKYKRVTQITEVRKRWENDPMEEKAFVDLMKYEPKTDELLITPDLKNGDSEILKAIAGNVKEFAGSWDAVWDNILLRGTIKENIVKMAEQTKNDELLEAPFVTKANDMFHIISEKVKEEVGFLDSKKILFQWNDWLSREVRKTQKS